MVGCDARDGTAFGSCPDKERAAKKFITSRNISEQQGNDDRPKIALEPLLRIKGAETRQQTEQYFYQE